MGNRGSPIVLGLLALHIVVHAASAQRGRIEVDTVRSASLANLIGARLEARVSVYLPPSYDSSPRSRYPVVYLLHGFASTELMWTHPRGYIGVAGIMDSLVATHVAKEMIVVMPNASNPVGGSFYVNSVVTGNWEDFVVHDLVAWTDARYRTLARPESRGIAGASMGGYGAFYLGLRHGGTTYGAAYAMSACCLMPLAFDPVRNGPAWEALAQASSFATLAPPLLPLAVLSAAFAPDVTKPPLFFDLAEERHDGAWKANPSVVEKFDDHAPLLMIPRYRDNLLHMRPIQFDGGLQDEVVPPAEWMRMDTALTKAAIPHTFELFEGTHVNRTGSRLMLVFPFFSRALVFAEGSAR
jgi:hypothetical protein